CRAGLLGVAVGEDRPLLGDAVDVGRAVAHHAAVVGADVPVADVVAPEDEDVRLLAVLPDLGAGGDHFRLGPGQEAAPVPALGAAGGGMWRMGTGLRVVVPGPARRGRRG